MSTTQNDMKWEEVEGILARAADIRRQRDALLSAAKLALPGLRHLQSETKFSGVAADAMMAANTLEAAIALAEKP